MEETFHIVASYIALIVEMAAVAVVACGAGAAFVRLVTLASSPGSGWQPGSRKAIWRDFGIWLVLGLEFELAADIVKSVVTPTWLETGQLAAIAVIRTFLNYFLEKDLEGAARETSAGTLAVAPSARRD